MHKLQAVEALAKGFRQIGITLQPSAAIRPPTGFQFLEILLHGLRQSRIIGDAVAAVPRRQAGSVRADAVRTSLMRMPPITRRSCASPRTQSFSTLSSERPIRWLTSGNVSPSKCRRTMTSR